jgi:hypothetical protein
MDLTPLHDGFFILGFFGGMALFIWALGKMFK